MTTTWLIVAAGAAALVAVPFAPASDAGGRYLGDWAIWRKGLLNSASSSSK